MRTAQHRHYVMHDRPLEQFLDLFSKVVAVREKYGFRMDGAWVLDEGREFIWVVSHQGDEDAFKAAEAEYYDSPERAALPEEPQSYVASSDLRLMRTVGE